MNITLRESVDSILYDLIYNLARALEAEREIAREAKQIREWITEEVASVRGFALGFSMVASANVNVQKSEMPRFNFFAAKEKLAELIEKTVRMKEKLILLIDELDKERKEDVLRTLDAIKSQIVFEGLVVILALPYSIYREYSADRMRWNEAGNLENIFKDIVFLEPLSKSDIKELLIRRIREHLDLVSQEVLEIASDFADGNPRDAIWILNKTVFENVEEKRISKEHIVRTIEKLVGEYFVHQLTLTENQRKALRTLRNFTGSKEQLVSELQKVGIKRTTAYSVIEQLVQKKILLFRNGVYRLSGKFKHVDMNSLFQIR
ncbi:P-loop NTPase fold protein [Pseudothermotoga hypogea]